MPGDTKILARQSKHPYMSLTKASCNFCMLARRYMGWAFWMSVKIWDPTNRVNSTNSVPQGVNLTVVDPKNRINSTPNCHGCQLDCGAVLGILGEGEGG